MSDSNALADLTVRDLLERLASRAPAPGGGSAAALAGAMGAALVAMVAELTIGRPEYAEHEAAATQLRRDALARKDLLLELADEDAMTYQAVVDARRLPRESEPEREARSVAMRSAMLAAARVPMRIATVAAEVLALAEQIAPIGNRNAASDSGVAAQLAAAALRGAVLNVRINLPYLPADEALRLSAPGEISRLEMLAAEREAAALRAVDALLVSA